MLSTEWCSCPPSSAVVLLQNLRITTLFWFIASLLFFFFFLLWISELSLDNFIKKATSLSSQGFTMWLTWNLKHPSWFVIRVFHESLLARVWTCDNSSGSASYNTLSHFYIYLLGIYFILFFEILFYSTKVWTMDCFKNLICYTLKKKKKIIIWTPWLAFINTYFYNFFLLYCKYFVTFIFSWTQGYHIRLNNELKSISII